MISKLKCFLKNFSTSSDNKNLNKILHNRYVVLDWDDTLVDTMRLSLPTFNKLCEKLNINKCFTKKEVLEINSTNFEKWFESFFGENAKTAIEAYRTIYDSFEKDLQLHKGAREFLDLLKSKKIKCGIISNKPHALLESEVRRLDIYKYMDFCVGSGVFGELKKPNPELIKCIADRDKINLCPNNIMFLGDSLIDIKFVQNSGIKYMGFVGHSTCIEEFLQKNKNHKIHFIKKDFEELTQELKNEN